MVVYWNVLCQIMWHKSCFVLVRLVTIKSKLVETVGDKYAVFKLKTTAPKRYAVRPKEGIVPPHSTEKIEGFFSIIERLILWYS